MGKGTPLSWADTKKHSDLVRRVGVKQFLALYKNFKDRNNDVLKWGDEVDELHCFCIMECCFLGLQIEYTLITLDSDEKKARLSLLGPDILSDLQQPEIDDPLHHKTQWKPEYSAYMIEGTQSSF